MIPPQHFSEGELIFFRAVLGDPDDSAGRLGREENFTPQSEESAMEPLKATLVLEHGGTCVRIEQSPDEGGSEELAGAFPVALDFGRWIKIASCVASCLVGGAGASNAAGHVADVKPSAGSNAKPAK